MSRLWNLPVFAAAVLFTAGYTLAQAPDNNAADQPAAQSEDQDKQAQEKKDDAQNNAARQDEKKQDQKQQDVQKSEDQAAPAAPGSNLQPAPAPGRVDGVRDTIPGTAPPQPQPAPAQPQDPVQPQAPTAPAPPAQPQTPESAAPQRTAPPQPRDDARRDDAQRQDRDAADRSRQDRSDRADRQDDATRTERTEERTRTERTQRTERTERTQRDQQQPADLGWQLEARDDRLVIESIDDNSPLADSDLQEGDEIISINGRQFRSADEVQRFIRQSQQRQAQIMVRRDGEQHTFNVNLPRQDRREQFGQRARDQRGRHGQQAAMGVWIDTARPGLYVMALPENSPAAEAGLRPGDRIISVNGRRFDSAHDLIAHLSELETDRAVEVEYMRNGQIFVAECQLGARGDIYGQTTFTQAPALGQQGQQEYSAMRPQMGEANVQELKQEVEMLKRQVEQLRHEMRQMKMDGAGSHETRTQIREDFQRETREGIREQGRQQQFQGQQRQDSFQGTHPAPPAAPQPFDRDDAVAPPELNQPGAAPAAPQGTRTDASPAPRPATRSDDNAGQRDNRGSNQSNPEQNDR